VSSTNSVTPRLGFTKSNELFVGRLAMLGFASSLIGEVRLCAAMVMPVAA
jgi:hypothetical protein